MKFPIFAFFLSLFSLSAFAQNTLSYTEIEAHYNNGLELYEKKAYAAARKELQTYVLLSENSLSPNNFNIANARYYSAVSSLNSKAKDADIEVERFVIKYPNHPKAQVIYLDLGTMYFDNGDYDNAIEFLSKSLEGRADNLVTLEARYKLGVSYYMIKDLKSALEQFDYVKNTSAESSIHAAYYAGVIHFQNKNYSEAYNDLKRVENVDPYKTEIPNWLGQILFREKKYNDLLTYAEPIIQNPNGRKTDELALMVAEVYYSKDNFEKSAFYFDKFKTFKKPSSDQINFRHAFAHYKSGNFEKAAQLFRSTANLNSEIGQQSAYYLGISALRTNDVNAAMLAFQEAQKLDFDKDIKEEAQYNLIKILVEKNNSAQALTSLKTYLKEYPNGKYVDESNEFLTDVLAESNTYTSAISYIEGLSKRTSKIDATYQKLCFNQGIVEFNGGAYEKANQYLDKAINTRGSADVVNKAKYWKAESYAQLKDPKADQYFEELTNNSDPEIRLKSQYSIAYTKFNEKDYSNAQTYFQNFYSGSAGIKSLENNREDALVRMADCKLSSKNYSEALKLYHQAFTENKSDKDYSLYQKGVAYKLLDKDSEAKETFDRFAKLYPNSRLMDDALYQTGILDMEKGSYSSAISSFSELLNKRPTSSLVPSALLKRALSYSNTDKHDKAIEDYKLIIDKYSKTKAAEEALLGMKESLNSLGKSEDFGEIANQYSKSNPASSSSQNLQFDAAKDLYFAEKYDKAIVAFQQFIRSNPENSNVDEANFLIAESYFYSNKKMDALTYYEGIIEKNVTEFISKSAMRSADIQMAEKLFDGAIKNYTKVTVSSSSQREITLANEGLYKVYFLKGEYDKCIEIADKVANEADNSVVNSQIRSQLWKAKALQQKRDYSTAKSEYAKVIALGKDIHGAEAKYKIAEIQYLSKEHDASIKTCQELSNDFGDFAEWYENAFLLIAENYISKDDKFMAKATLKSIIENAETPATVEKAKNKLNSISK
ncbi:MAG: tetratricopeptide repeat protein [Leadbetterella sp.]